MDPKEINYDNQNCSYLAWRRYALYRVPSSSYFVFLNCNQSRTWSWFSKCTGIGYNYIHSLPGNLPINTQLQYVIL